MDKPDLNALDAAIQDADESFPDEDVGKPCPTCPPGPADDRLLACILELCKTDRDVVAKARKLTLLAREPKKIILHRYTGGKWTQRSVTSLGSARGTTVWINRDLPCSKVKSTIYHEIVHTEQSPKMSKPDREVDAYTKTEQWTIDRNQPGQAGKKFRQIADDGSDAVNKSAIKDHVKESYGYNVPASGPAPPQVDGRSDDGKKVKMDDGSTRDVKEGDAFKEVPPQDLKERRIPPDKLTCP